MSAGKKRQRDDDGHQTTFARVDQETSQYFNEINTHFKTLDSHEDKQLLANNVLEEAAERGAEVATDAACSRVLEALLPFASIEAISKYAKHCVEGENLGKLCTRYVEYIDASTAPTGHI